MIELNQNVNCCKSTTMLCTVLYATGRQELEKNHRLIFLKNAKQWLKTENEVKTIHF